MSEGSSESHAARPRRASRKRAAAVGFPAPAPAITSSTRWVAAAPSRASWTRGRGMRTAASGGGRSLATIILRELIVRSAACPNDPLMAATPRPVRGRPASNEPGHSVTGEGPPTRPDAHDNRNGRPDRSRAGGGDPLERGFRMAELTVRSTPWIESGDAPPLPLDRDPRDIISQAVADPLYDYDIVP